MKLPRQAFGTEEYPVSIEKARGEVESKLAVDGKKLSYKPDRAGYRECHRYSYSRGKKGEKDHMCQVSLPGQKEGNLSF